MALTTFTSGQVLTAAQLNAVQANDYNQTVSTKTASYTLVAADKGTRVVMNVATANTVTVNTSLFSAGDTLVIQNIGAGTTTVTAGTATVSSAGPLTILQYGSGTLYFTSAGVSLWFPSAGPAASASALTRIASGNLSGASTVFSNAFSSAYDNYIITISNLVRAASASNFRLRLGAGTDHNYNEMYNTTGGVFISDSSGATQNQFDVGFFSSTFNVQAQILLLSPYLAKPTGMQSLSFGYSVQYHYSNGVELSSTSFTDFTISVAASTFTSGYVQIYGIANS
jgi:hypothetical protein